MSVYIVDVQVPAGSHWRSVNGPIEIEHAGDAHACAVDMAREEHCGRLVGWRVVVMPLGGPASGAAILWRATPGELDAKRTEAQRIASEVFGQGYDVFYEYGDDRGWMSRWNAWERNGGPCVGTLKFDGYGLVADGIFEGMTA